MKRLHISAIGVAIVVIACTSRESEIYALYRNSVLDKDMRIHVATFDATEGERYNRENCERAQTLFQAQPNVDTKFWCEKGAFRK